MTGTKASRTPWYHPGSAMNDDTRGSLPFILPVTRARRNPLLSVHGFGSEASSALDGLVRTIHQLSRFRLRHVLFLVAATRTSELRLAKRLFGFGRWTLADHFGNRPNEPLHRTEQGISGEDYK